MKNLKKSILLLSMMLVAFLTFGQNQKFTVSGQVSDAANGEDIPFANIFIKNLSGVGTSSNVYGFYSITLEEGEYEISFQYLGYKTIDKKINLNKNFKIDIELAENSNLMEEVVVTAEREDQNITRNEGSVTKLEMKDIKEIPVFGGEPDVSLIDLK